MFKGYLMMFNALTEILVQLRMLEASIITIQRRAEELYIEAEDL